MARIGVGDLGAVTTPCPLPPGVICHSKGTKGKGASGKGELMMGKTGAWPRHG